MAAGDSVEAVTPAQMAVDIFDVLETNLMVLFGFLCYLSRYRMMAFWAPRWISLLIRDAPYEKACPARRPPELLKPTLIWTEHSCLLENNDRLSLTLNKAK